MVPGGGLEPPWDCSLRILSPLRLPISPSGPMERVGATRFYRILCTITAVAMKRTVAVPHRNRTATALRLHSCCAARRDCRRILGRGRVRCAVQAAIHFPIAQDGFDIFACLRKWNRLHKLRQAAVGTVGEPGLHAIVAGIVRGQRIFRLAVELIHQLAKIYGAQFQIHLRDSAKSRFDRDARVACAPAHCRRAATTASAPRHWHRR